MKNKFNKTLESFMKHLMHPLFLMLFLMVCSSSVKAVEDNYTASISGGQIYDFPFSATLNIDDADFAGTNLPYQKAENYILLQAKPSNVADYTAKIEVRINYTDENNTLHIIPSVILEVEHNNNAGTVIQDKDVYLFSGGHDVTVTITDFCYNVNNCNISSGHNFTPNLELINHITVNRLLEFDCEDSPATVTVNPNLTTDNEILVNWAPVDGAEEYQLEWLHINDYNGLGGQIPFNSLFFDFGENATRIATVDTEYNVSMVFEQGYVLFRVRALSFSPDNLNIPIFGEWSIPSGEQNITTGIPQFQITQGLIHESDDFNWQYSASYAEEGRKKEMVTYMDGTLRSHQVVTKINTDEQAIVGETFYDYQGRGAVQTLPAPAYRADDTRDGRIMYYPDFNQVTPGVGYSRTDFDEDSDCISPTQPMHTGSGASQYYSNDNPDQVGHQAYVPDAEGFPFTQIEFEPDNTGRLRRQGGVGIVHQLGNGHETKYFYGKPTQDKLRQLFASEAGNVSHYRKKMIIDPNGQVSVSYIDMSGRTIATALAGNTPDNLTALDSNNENPIPEVTTVSILDNQALQPSGASISVYHHLVTTAGDQTFDYTLNCNDFSQIDDADFCLQCVYDITISIVGECGTVIESRTQEDVSYANDEGGNCSDPLFTASFTIEDLALGKYVITKTVEIDQEALAENTEACITRRTETGELISYSEFEEDALGSLDLTQCDQLDCSSYCTLILEGNSTDQELMEECMNGCQNAKCSATRQLMLQDFRPRNSDDFNFDYDYGDEDPPIGNIGTYEVDFTPNGDGLSSGQFATYQINDDNDEYESNDACSVFTPNNNHGIDYTALEYLDEDDNPAMVADEAGNLILLSDAFDSGNYTLEDFINDFEPSWAEAWLPFHPEACRLDFCFSNTESEVYNQLMLETDNYDDALALGLMDPLGLNPNFLNDNRDPFFPNGTAEFFAMELYFDEINFPNSANVIYSGTLWEIAAVLGGNCIDGTVVDQTCTSTFESSPSEMDECIKDMVWFVFRAMYLQKKMEIYDGAMPQYCVGECIEGNISHFQSYTGLIDEWIQQAEGVTEDQLGTGDQFEENCTQGIIAQCEANTEMLATSIMRKLKGCLAHVQITNLCQTCILLNQDGAGNPLPCEDNCTDCSSCEDCETCSNECIQCDLWQPGFPAYDAIKAGLMEVMMLSCGFDLPFGASTAPPPGHNPIQQCYGTGGAENTPIPMSTYNSFADVIIGVLGTNAIDLECNADLISFPPAFGHDNSASAEYAPVDNCACEAIFESINEYDENNSPEGVDSEEEFFEHTYDINVINYGAIKCACTSALGYEPNSDELEDLVWTQDQLDALANSGQFINAGVSCPHCVECVELIDEIEDYSVNGVTISTNPVISFTPYGGTELEESSIQTMLTNHLNNHFNVDLAYYQYFEFVAECNGAYDTGNCDDLTDVGQSFVNILNMILSRGTLLNENCFCKDPFIDEYANVLAEVLNPDFNTLGCNDIYLPNPSEVSQTSITATVFNQPDSPSDCEWTMQFYGQVPENYNIANIDGPLENIRPNPNAPDATNQFLADVEISSETVTILVTSSCYDIWECDEGPLELCSSYLVAEIEDCLDDLEEAAESNAEIAYETYIEEVITEIEEEYIEECQPDYGEEQFDMTYVDNEYHYTLYYHDQAGNLVRTIPPEGVELLELTDEVNQRLVNDSINGTQTVFTQHRMETRYKYNSLNQLTHQTMPDHENFGGVQITTTTTGIPPGMPVASIVFVDANTGILFSGIEGASQNFFPIYTTSDGGATWTLANIQTIGMVTGAFHAPGGEVHAVTEFGVPHIVSDLGATSTLLATTVLDFITNSVYFLDQDHGIIVGENGGVVVTMDAGVTWMPLTNNILENDDWNDAILFTDTNGNISAYIVGTDERVIRINDIFNPTYNIIPSTTGEELNSITFCGSVGFIAGENGILIRIEDIYAANVTLTTLESTSGGIPVDWVTCTDPNQPGTDVHLNDIVCIDQTTIYAVGNNSVILQSTDGGITWTRITHHGDVGDINEITFITGEQFILSSTNDNVGNTTPTIITNTQGEWSRCYYYDRLGRIVASQDSRQANFPIPRYSYTTYDELGRIIESGELISNTEPTDALLNNQNPCATFPQTPGCPLPPCNAAVNVAYPDNWSVERVQVSKTYYDRPLNSTIEMQFENDIQQNLRNRVATVTFIENYDACNPDAYDHASHFSYDIHGNVRELVQENTELVHVGQQYKKMDYDYDLISGNVHQVSYQEGEADRFFHRYEYDADNRITRVMTSPDGMIWDEDARYTYYRHGSLARSEIGDLRVQGCDYAYTIQGWIKAINGNTLNPTDDMGQDGTTMSDVLPDVHGFSLGYFNGDYQAIDANNYFTELDDVDPGNTNLELFNGNISKMVTAISPMDNANVNTPITQGSAYHYDQLNRILSSATFGIGGGTDGLYNTSYTYDANGNIIDLNRNGNINGMPEPMDNLRYQYQLDGNNNIVNNKLLHVNENFDQGSDINDNDFTVDIDEQGTYDPKNFVTHNYDYDPIGNLIQDASEEIERIVWRVDGKVQRVIRETDSNLPDLLFKYDASGNRITKAVFHKAPAAGQPDVTYTHYVRDASGNTMAVYNRTQSVGTRLGEIIELDEHHLYGSSRLGILDEDIRLVGGQFANLGMDDLGEYQVGNVIFATTLWGPLNRTGRPLGAKRYELSNHLGNVLATVSDRRLWDDSGFIADLISASDYYPFGMAMMGRGATNGYRYGFNGQEMDDEIYGEGNALSYQYRIQDARLGRFLSVDPISGEYPWYSSYQFAGNTPIWASELEGLEPDVTSATVNTNHYFDFSESDISSPGAQAQFMADAWNEINSLYSGFTIDNQQISMGSGVFTTDFNETNNGLATIIVSVKRGSGTSNANSSTMVMELYENDWLPGMGFMGNTFVHEFGHFFGLSDRYYEVAFISDNAKYYNKKKVPFDKDKGRLEVRGERLTYPIVSSRKSNILGRDPNYVWNDNLYSTGSLTLTTSQVSVVFGLARPEPDYDNGIMGVIKGREELRNLRVSGIQLNNGAGFQFYNLNTGGIQSEADNINLQLSHLNLYEGDIILGNYKGKENYRKRDLPAKAELLGKH